MVRVCADHDSVMSPAWVLLLLLLRAANARQQASTHTDTASYSVKPTQCLAEVAPVCVEGGLWVMNRCLAAVQRLHVLEQQACQLEGPDAFTEPPGGPSAVSAAGRPQMLPASSAFYRKHGSQFLYLGLRAPGTFKQRHQSAGLDPAAQASGTDLWSSCILEQVDTDTLSTVSSTRAFGPADAQASLTGQAKGQNRVSGWWHWWCSKPQPPPASPPVVGNATCLLPGSKGENLTALAVANATATGQDVVQPAFYGPRDDSVMVKNPVYPFGSFVKVSLDSMNVASKEIYKDDVQCSGTVISRTSILTAAHCVFFRTYNEYITLAGGRVIIGDQVDPHPQVNEVAVWSYMKAFPRIPPNAFENWRFDVAILTLKDPIEDRFVTVPVLPPDQGPNCWTPKHGDLINAAGYPMEYPRKKQNQQWMHACKLVSRYPRIIRSTCDTLKGQSGGPVWFTGRDTAGVQRSIVIGIVVGGEPGPTPPLPDTEGLDVERRIDAAAYEFLKQRAGRMFNVVSQQ